MIILKEAYSKPNISFVKKIMANIKQDFFEEEDITEGLLLLNKNFYKYGIIFTTEELPLLDWAYREQGIQTSYIEEDGTIFVVVDKYFIENNNNESSYKELLYVLNSILSHELLHRQQIQKVPPNFLKKVNLKSNESYLSDTREIASHALQTVEDLSRWHSPDKILKIISNYDSVKNSVTDSEALWKYWSYFGLYSDTNDNKENNKVWKQFLKKVYYFVKEIDK